MSEDLSARRYWSGVIGLSLLALIGNWLSLPLFFGIDLIFGSVAVMLAAAWLGIWAAGLVAVAGALYTIILWEHPYAIPAFVLEGLLVAWLYHRRQLKNLVLADLLFWVVVGIPVVVLIYSFVLDMAGSAVGLIALKQAVNGVFNALLAGLLILSFALWRQRSASLSLPWIVFHAILTAILFVGMVPILFDAMNQREQQERVMLERLNEIATIFATRLQADPMAEQRLDYHRSRLQNMFPMANLALVEGLDKSVQNGQGLRIHAPAFSQKQTTSQEKLNIWLPEGDFSAVARWRAGYYWLQQPLTDHPEKHIVIEFPAAQLVQRMEQQRLTKFAFLAGVFLLSIMLAGLIGRLLSRPITRFAEASQRIEGGVLSGSFSALPGHIAQEFDQLSSALNHMGSELAASVRVLRDSRGQLAKNVAARTRELAETNGLLSSVLDAAEDFSIIATDPDGLITLFNTGAESLLGYTAEELIGLQTPAIFHDPEEVQTVAAELSTRFGQPITGFKVFVFEAEQGVRQAREWSYFSRSGERFSVRLVVSVIQGPDGAIAGYLGIAEDVSARKQLEQVKSEFISTVSHELRTPLTSISGALGLLKAGALGELSQQANEMVALAHNNSQRLGNLINDLLDIEKIAAGKLYFDYQWVSLSDQLSLALSGISQYAPEQEIRIAPLSAVPAVQIRVDTQRLQQVLANLLSNAVKFSRPGGPVVLDAKVIGEHVRVSVHDQGEGIAEAFQQRIFQRFAQADSSDQRKKGGTGLGLAISKELVEHMGGNIGFDSVPGEGTVFWFEFPFQPIDSNVQTDGSLPAAIDQLQCVGRILHVEDDRDLYQVIRQAAGSTVYFALATSLAEARSRLHREEFDVVLLDPGLPDGNGIDLIEDIRQLQPGCGIMLLTGQPVDLALRLKVDGAMLKSAWSVEDLLERLHQLISAGASKQECSDE